MKLTHDRLLDVLSYDAETGLFQWTGEIPNRRLKVGWITEKGYRHVEIDCVSYSLHRLAWLYVYGVWPNQIDHINGDRLDNRLANLRNVDRKINAQNQRQASRNNRTGYLGVTKMCQRYRSQVRDPVGKKIVYLGTFDTPQQAHEAYVLKKRELHPGCTI